MILAAQALRYWHTLRHLKPIQFYGRLWFMLRRPRLTVVAAAPPLRHQEGQWQLPALRQPSMLGPWHFRFLNREHRLEAQADWNDASLEKLWLYNLHYFDDLNARAAHLRGAWHQALLRRWMAENPPLAGNAWEPYPTSLRIVNWVKWLLAGHRPPPGFAQSLATQARWLAKRLEWHLLGNHLFANAKALVFAGLLFEGTEAERWLAQGLRIIARELPEQVLPDGGNFERSTMYHAIFLEDLLDLVNAAKVWPQKVGAASLAVWHGTARRMLAWLEGMVHPDGQIALFNDAAFGIAPEPRALRDYAQRLGIRAESPPVAASLTLQHWESSGYVRMSSGEAMALLDVAPVGPDYLPGHAHADTLSFELSVHGYRVVVNGGTSRYGLGPERLRERETAMHSTVEVAGLSSSEVWGGFRVARRAHPIGLQTRIDDESVWVSCSHDGYTRLPGQPVHRREWKMAGTGLLVSDRVTDESHLSLARFIFHPSVRVSGAGGSGCDLTLPDGKVIRLRVLSGRARMEAACYAPEFGKTFDTRCLAVELVSGLAMTQLMWG